MVIVDPAGAPDPARGGADPELLEKQRRFAELAEPGTAHGVSGERLLHEAAPDAAAWHSGIAAVLPRQYAAFRAAVEEAAA